MDCEVAVKLLLDHGAHVNVIGFGLMTPLHIAAICAYMPVVKLLLQSPYIDIAMCDEDGKTALDEARKAGKSEVVQVLQDFQKPPPKGA